MQLIYWQKSNIEIMTLEVAQHDQRFCFLALRKAINQKLFYSAEFLVKNIN